MNVCGGGCETETLLSGSATATVGMQIALSEAGRPRHFMPARFVVGTRTSSDPPLDRLPTDAVAVATLAKMRQALEACDLATFRTAAGEDRRTDWSAPHYRNAIDMMISMHVVSLARSTLDEAVGRFPHDSDLQRLLRVLEPPRSVAPTSMRVDHSASQEWLERHADEFKGRWVALRQGCLVADASSVVDLTREIGPPGRYPDLLVLRIA